MKLIVCKLYLNYEVNRLVKTKTCPLPFHFLSGIWLHQPRTYTNTCLIGWTEIVYFFFQLNWAFLSLFGS